MFNQIEKEPVINKKNGPYIIAEIGANHNGDMSLAKEMIDAAKECGCDAVKFQSWDTDSLFSKCVYAMDEKSNQTDTLYKAVERYYLRPEQHLEMKSYCDLKKIDFSSTPFSKKEVDLLNTLEVKFFKIASMDINNIDLITYIARCQKPILLSTGMANLFEIEKAVKIIERCNNKNIVLLHCVSDYPPQYEDLNLMNIRMLKEYFGYPVGFSDHTIGYSIPIAAVALGACVIEKHFTIDKELSGWDHKISADIEEMKIIVQESKNISRAVGTYRRKVSTAEEKMKKKFRRSIVLTKNKKKGEMISTNDITAKRPGTGVPPDKANYILGKTVNRDMAYDEILKWRDIS
jgi:sialic acid synthase SpsE